MLILDKCGWNTSDKQTVGDSGAPRWLTAAWKVNFKAVKGARWGSEPPPNPQPRPPPLTPDPPSVPHLLYQANWNLLCRVQDHRPPQMAPQGSLMAGRCHGGTGREERTPPTSPRNSQCDGLWVSASPDIIRRWDPDVRLSWCFSDLGFQQRRKGLGGGSGGVVFR